MPTVKELAKMIDHSLLHPTMTDSDLKRECDVAKAYDVASVCIKPYAVKEAVKWLEGTDVKVGSVIGFPHGNSSTEIKIKETRLACEEGATEIDMVVNIGKVLGGDWEFVADEIGQIAVETHRHGAILKVIFENDFVTKREDKINLCEICSEKGADFVKTSTGYGFVKGSDGAYSYKGATEEDLKLMREHTDPDVQVKAAGGIRTLDDLLHVRDLGVTRVGATATETILEAAKKRFK